MDRIRDLRKELGLSQRELAQDFGINQSAVSAWETGRSLPDGETLKRLADYFGVSVDYLLGRIDSEPPDNTVKYRLVEDTCQTGKTPGMVDYSPQTSGNMSGYRELIEKGLLRTARQMAGLTQEEVATQMGITRQTYANIENGIQEPNLRTLYQLAHVIRVNPHYIINLKSKLKQYVTEHPPLSERTAVMLDRFNQLNDEGQDKVISYAEDLINSGQYKRDAE